MPVAIMLQIDELLILSQWRHDSSKAAKWMWIISKDNPEMTQ